MEKKTKNFHFQELDWIISFPDLENKGRKYINYSVSISKLKNGQRMEQVCLGDILQSAEFEKNLPLTVGFFRESSSNNRNAGYEYLEIRMIGTVEDFWKFLNDTNI